MGIHSELQARHLNWQHENINEMPTFNLEHKFAPALAADAVKANTKNETVKKIESRLLLSKDFADSFKANSIKQYYENLKAQLEREYILKNYTRCAFEEHLLQKCNTEIAKCDKAYKLSLLFGINNAAEIIG
jgi:hypothetical protein